jgi:hypothetical protein
MPGREGARAAGVVNNESDVDAGLRAASELR